MSKTTISICLFACFAFGFPIWAMYTNQYDNPSVHGCSGECYRQWQQQTGGVTAIAKAELGQQAYAGCVACHGARGEGGVGPRLAGQSADEIAAKLLQYKNGETRGAQSALMWSQANQLSEADIDNLAAYTATF